MIHEPPHRAWLLLAALAILATSCAQTPDEKTDPGDEFELQKTLQQFHRDLRWGEFESAAQTVTESHRQTFLGRYEEYGDDLDIVNLEVEAVRSMEDNRRRVEVEQEWLVEPDMRVRDDTFVEIWTPAGQGWMLEDRMKKQEWERQHESDTRSTSSPEEENGPGDDATGGNTE